MLSLVIPISQLHPYQNACYPQNMQTYTTCSPLVHVTKYTWRPWCNLTHRHSSHMHTGMPMPLSLLSTSVTTGSHLTHVQRPGNPDCLWDKGRVLVLGGGDTIGYL